MRNLKMFQAALVLAVLSIVVGCSDQFTSPNQEFVKSSNKGKGSDLTHEKSSANVINPVEADKHVNPLYHTQISLKPGGVYKFELSNTGLNRFTSVDVSRVETASQKAEKIFDPCDGINVYSNSKKSLSCHSKNFKEREIYVQNTSSIALDFDVLLFGTQPIVKDN